MPKEKELFEGKSQSTLQLNAGAARRDRNSR